MNMQKQIIEAPAQNQDNQEQAKHSPMSDELQQAIQSLISRLKGTEAFNVIADNENEKLIPDLPNDFDKDEWEW
jgi:hypothetical protein